MGVCIVKIAYEYKGVRVTTEHVHWRYFCIIQNVIISVVCMRWDDVLLLVFFIFFSACR